MKSLLKKIEELNSYIPKADMVKAPISGWSVGQQIEHSLNVIEVAITAVKKSDPKLYKPSFNIYKTVLLAIGYFPRGKVRAPKSVRPNDKWNEEALIEQINRIKKALAEIKGFQDNSHMNHPIFGHLNKKTSIRFMNVHTEHHLKIIREILNS